VVRFDREADAYDAARPSYPPGLYDLLESIVGPLADQEVLDCGAGTGVASRQLSDRQAAVTALDPGVEMLRRAVARTPGMRTVVADAAAIPLKSSCVDLVCFAQSWHWVEQATGANEAARILPPGGWWAAWWSHAWADGDAWFEEYWDLLERSCPGVSRAQRNVDWAHQTVADHESFQPPERHIVPWVREVSVRSWVTELTSHSYVIAMAPADRHRLLIAVEGTLRRWFPDGQMLVPHQTRLWLARRD